MREVFESLDEVLAQIENAANPQDLDDALWLAMCDHIDRPADLEGFPDELHTYFASRYLEWEVANGGFVQVAVNLPEWFAPAERAYAKLGRPQAAQAIADARRIAEAEAADIAHVRSALQADGDGTAAVAAYTAYAMRSKLDAVDDSIDDTGFWTEGARMAWIGPRVGAIRAQLGAVRDAP